MKWIEQHPEWKCHVPACRMEREYVSWWCSDHRHAVAAFETATRCPYCGQLPPGVRATASTQADRLSLYGWMNTDLHERVNPCPIVRFATEGLTDDDVATDHRRSPARAAR